MNTSWGRILSGGFALFCAAVAGTWTISWSIYTTRIENLKEQVQSYESITGTNLPQLIKDLSSIAGDADSTIKLKNELSEKDQLLAAEKKENDELNKSYQKLEISFNELSSKIFLEENFNLIEGQSHSSYIAQIN